MESSISHNLKKYRKEKGLTQEKIAKALFVTPQAVSKWERGDSLPDISLIPQIATLFDISISDLWSKEIVTERNIPFKKLMTELKEVNHINELVLGFDFFITLTEKEKHLIMKELLKIPGSDFAVEDFYVYLSRAQKEELIMTLLVERRFIALESLIPLMGRSIRTKVLEEIIEYQAFEFLEELFPFLNYSQKQLVVLKVRENKLGLNKLENYLTFFTEKQREELAHYEED